MGVEKSSATWEGVGGVIHDPGGRKSFFWYAKVNGIPRFRALGEFSSVAVGEARTAAKRWAGIAAAWKQSGYEGKDPFDKKHRSEPASVPTFSALIEAYITNHIHSLDENQRANHPETAEYRVRWIVKRHFKSWLERKLDEISVEDVLVVKNACGKRIYLANRAIEFIRALFNWSGETPNGKVNFWRAENPAKNVESFPEKPRTRFLQPAELVKFNQALKDEVHTDLRDFLTLAISQRRADQIFFR